MELENLLKHYYFYNLMFKLNQVKKIQSFRQFNQLKKN